MLYLLLKLLSVGVFLVLHCGMLAFHLAAALTTTGREAMEQIRVASKTTAKKGSFEIDQLVWPTPCALPERVTWLMIVIEIAAIYTGFKVDWKTAVQVMIGEMGGGFLLHLGYFGGTFEQRIRSTVPFMWGYIAVAVITHLVYSAGRVWPCLLTDLLVFAVGVGFARCLFNFLGVSPAVRGRELV